MYPLGNGGGGGIRMGALFGRPTDGVRSGGGGGIVEKSTGRGVLAAGGRAIDGGGGMAEYWFDGDGRAGGGGVKAIPWREYWRSRLRVSWVVIEVRCEWY